MFWRQRRWLCYHYQCRTILSSYFLAATDTHYKVVSCLAFHIAQMGIVVAGNKNVVIWGPQKYYPCFATKNTPPTTLTLSQYLIKKYCIKFKLAPIHRFVKTPLISFSDIHERTFSQRFQLKTAVMRSTQFFSTCLNNSCEHILMM